MDLSIIVNLYNMEREAPRTLYSLCRAYQQHVEQLAYEVIIVDNGSCRALPDDLLAQLNQFGPQFICRRVDPASARPSPAAAMNEAARAARGRWLAIMIDGARLLSPGVLHQSLLATRLAANPIIITHGFHLGPEPQFRSVPKGYNQTAEDRLLEQIDWQRNGYRLFEIACFSGASRRGWFCLPAESNCLLLGRETFDRLGGMDERFTSPGGGLVNLDFCGRACRLPDAAPVLLIGEGSFHQYHGGVTTSLSVEQNNQLWQQFDQEYRCLHGNGFQRPTLTPLLFGQMPPSCAATLSYSAEAFAQELGTGSPRPQHSGPVRSAAPPSSLPPP